MKPINISRTGFDYYHSGHTGYSTFGKKSKYIEWRRDNSAPGGKVYVDDQVMHAHNEAIYPKYAWFIEPRSIVPSTYQWLDSNIDHLLATFEKIIVSDTRLLSISPKFVWSPVAGSWIKDIAIHPKSKLVSMIASNKNMCFGHKKRLIWRERLEGLVDLYGRGFTPVERKEEALNDYMFSVVIENEESPGYFTEKILDCFLTGTIPIYMGAPNIGKYFNTDGILLLEETGVNVSRDLYLSKRAAIQENFERALQYEVIEDWIYPLCFKDS